jgi:hypothetical protein
MSDRMDRQQILDRLRENERYLRARRRACRLVYPRHITLARRFVDGFDCERFRDNQLVFMR